MKKILVLMFCLVLTLSLVGCKAKSTENKSYNTTVNESDDNNVSINTVGSIQEGICELYLEVLEDLWNVDPGLNNEISKIGIDLSELSDLTEVEKDYVMSKFASKHNLQYIVGTFEELCEQGYIDKEKLIWEDGLFFSIKTNEDKSTFDAQKWRSGLGAYFFGQCTAQKDTNGKWSYTIGQEMIA